MAGTTFRHQHRHKLAAALVLIFPLTIAAAPDWYTLPSATQSGLRGLSVPSANVAWASGENGAILFSKDGGLHWSLLPVAGAASLDFRDIEAIDDRRAVVMSAGTGSQSAVFFTDDGGVHWQRTLLNPDPKGFFDALAFPTPRHGFVVGDPVGGHAALFETVDSGLSWKRIAGPALLPGESLFAASGTCLLAAKNSSELWIATGGIHQARVLSSSDWGKSWTASIVPIRHGSASSGVFSLAFYPPRDLFAVGGDYQQPGSTSDLAAQSSNGGRSWSVAPPLSGYRSSVIAIPGHSSKTLVAVGTNGSDRSTDHGRHWQRFSSVPLNTVASDPTGHTVIAVGPGGRIVRYRQE